VPRPRVSSDVEDRVVQSYVGGQSFKSIARQFHIAQRTVAMILSRYKIPVRQEATYQMPTPEEIEERKAEIQRGWDDKTRRLKAGTNGNGRVVLRPIHPLFQRGSPKGET